MPSVDDLKTRFQAQIAPGDDDEFLRILTEADLRLLEFGRWRWSRGRASLTPSAALVTLPGDYASILGARADTYPLDVRDEDFEFVPDGVGEVEVGGYNGVRLIDQGLNSSDLREYKVTGKDPDKDTYTVYTLCHFAPYTLYYAADIPDTPAVTDSTETRCPSAGALKLAMLAIVYEESGDMGSSSHYMSVSLRNLDNREKSRRGGSKQSVNLRPYGLGVSGIRSYR